MLNPEWFWQREAADPENQPPAPASAAEIVAAEQRLGVKLPESYLNLLRQQNGQYSSWRSYWNPAEHAYWNDVFIDGVIPVNQLETLQDFADATDFGDELSDWTHYLDDLQLLIVIAHHGWDWFTCLDFRANGPNGAPQVVEFDAVNGPQIKRRIKDFDTLLQGLYLSSEQGFEFLLNGEEASVRALLAGTFAIAAEALRDGAEVSLPPQAFPGIESLRLTPNDGLTQRLMPQAAWRLTLSTAEKLNRAQAAALNQTMQQVLANFGAAACLVSVPEAYLWVEDDPRDTPELVAAYLSLLRRQAEAGRVSAMQLLAKVYGDWQGGYAARGYPVDAAESAAWFQRALQTLRERAAAEDANDADVTTAIRGLAEVYEEGLGVTQDITQALHWYGRAAERMDRWSMLCLGRLYSQGGTVVRDLPLAEYWLKEAKNLEEDSYVNHLLKAIETSKDLVQLYGHGQLQPESDAEWQPFYLELAEAGDNAAMRELAKMYFLGLHQVEKEATQGLQWLRRAAMAQPLRGRRSSGEDTRLQAREAAEDLAEVYEYGRYGCARDLGEALRWHRHAAGLGSRWGMAWIAESYLDGTLNARDPLLATVWMAIATRTRYDGEEVECSEIHDRLQQLRGSLDADQLRQAEALFDQCRDAPPYPLPDLFSAPLTLATPAESGAVVDETGALPLKDGARGWFELGAQHAINARHTDALRAFTRAAEGGHVRAMIEIAKMHAAGKGVAADASEAARWYRRAAAAQDDASANGSSAAMAWLGFAHVKGLLGTPDPVLGYVWYCLAGRKRYNDSNPRTAASVQAWLEFTQDQVTRIAANLLTETQRNAAQVLLQHCDTPPFCLPADSPGGELQVQEILAMQRGTPPTADQADATGDAEAG